MKHVLAGIVGLALTGCAPAFPIVVWEPDSDSPPQPRPASQVMDERVVTARYGTGAIIVTSKEASWFAKGCTFDIALDDKLVAALRPGEQVVLFAEPGQRSVGFSVRDEASCDPASAQVALGVVAHTTQKIQIGSGAYYNLKVEVDTYGRSLPP